MWLLSQVVARAMIKPFQSVRFEAPVASSPARDVLQDHDREPFRSVDWKHALVTEKRDQDKTPFRSVAWQHAPAAASNHSCCGQREGSIELWAPPGVSDNRISEFSASAFGNATRTAGQPPDNCGSAWWIRKCLNLEPAARSGWVVAQAIHEFVEEDAVARACGKERFADRMRDAGLADLLDCTAPRKKCKAIGAAHGSTMELLDEGGQRKMLASISKSGTTYISGIRCWAAFCDACKIEAHFPATETDVVRYTSIFSSAETMSTYLKHLRWAMSLSGARSGRRVASAGILRADLRPA